MRLSAFRSTAAALLFFTGVTASAPASALFHAHLVRAEPAVNDTLMSTPKSVRLWFSEPLELALSRVKIMRIGGDTVKTGALRHEGDASTTASLDLLAPPTLPGTYVVTYHVVARDGHPTTGSYSFVVRAAGTK
jgi:methionine-rich copper-binding protein CopC